MAKITFNNKDKNGAAPLNQFRDVDANEIKTSVNILYDDKIETSAIANNLTTDNAAQVLSAAQGVELKSQVDAKVPIADIDTTEYAALPDAAGFAEDTLIFVNDPL